MKLPSLKQWPTHPPTDRVRGVKCRAPRLSNFFADCEGAFFILPTLFWIILFWTKFVWVHNLSAKHIQDGKYKIQCTAALCWNSPQLNSQAPHQRPPGALGEICLWHIGGGYIKVSWFEQRVFFDLASNVQDSYRKKYIWTWTKRFLWIMKPCSRIMPSHQMKSRVNFKSDALPVALTSSAGHCCPKVTNTRLHRSTKAGNVGWSFILNQGFYLWRNILHPWIQSRIRGGSFNEQIYFQHWKHYPDITILSCGHGLQILK